MAGATVRISEESRNLLRELARRTDASMQEVIERALAQYRERLFWERARSDFEALAGDPAAWKEELAERELWDATLGDGLDGEDPQ